MSKHETPTGPTSDASAGPSRRAALRALSALAVGSLTMPRVVQAMERMRLRGGAPDNARDAAREPGHDFTPGLSRTRPLVGLQLYTVRSLMQRDVPGTFAAISAAGVREVEFAGYFDRSPTDLRALLTAHGLTSPAAHVPIPKDWAPVFDAAEALGHTWLVVPWVGNDVRGSLDGWRRLADQLNEAGRLAAPRGLRMAYHNHDFEFTPVEGRVPYDVFLERLDPTLVDLELDLYWAVKAGLDPQAMFARHPGRFPMWHLKDAGPMPQRAMLDVGAGTIDFPALFAQSATSGLKHAFIEHDEPKAPLASVQASAAALQRMP